MMPHLTPTFEMYLTEITLWPPARQRTTAAAVAVALLPVAGCVATRQQLANEVARISQGADPEAQCNVLHEAMLLWSLYDCYCRLDLIDSLGADDKSTDAEIAMEAWPSEGGRTLQ